MMATWKLSLQGLLWRYGARLVHSGKKSSKKKYSYDLDSLIEWKKETHLAFGSPRKPTKTGKLRKTKKVLNHEIEEQLEILGSISTSQYNSEIQSSQVISKNGSDEFNEEIPSNFCDLNVPVEVLTSHLPSPDAVPIFGITRQTELIYNSKSNVSSSSKKNKNHDIPDEVFDSLAVVHNTTPVSAASDASEVNNTGDGGEEKSSLNEEFTEDAIYIPKITSVPSVSGRLSGISNHNRRKINSVTALENTSLVVENKNYTTGNQNMNLGTYSQKPQVEDVTKSSSKRMGKNSDTHFTVKSKSASASPKNKRPTEEELVIPKITPVPSGDVTMATTNTPLQLDFTVSHPASPFQRANPPPNEAPDSFEMICKIPLFPKENTKWQQTVDSQLLAAFRVEVEQMFVRVLPSVKTILSKTMPDLNRYFLNRWREGMINELGEEGFKKHQDATIKRGVNLHANIMEYLSGKLLRELQIMPDNEGHWSSLQKALATVSDIRALEVEIFHNILLYRGVFDCVARYKDVLCIIDWKTSKKPRPLLKNTYDDPVQIAAYMGALNASEAYVAKYGQVNHGMIVVAYPDGSPAHVHMMNSTLCEQYWQDWTDRLHNFFQVTYTEKIAVKQQDQLAQRK